MTKTWMVAPILALGVTILSPVHADDRKAAVLLRQGQVKEAVLGDVQSAIKLYEQAAAAAQGNRPIAAEALLAMANAKHKIGAPDARAGFERVVREFGDQKEFASAARTRLAALGGARVQADSAPRRVGALDTFGGDISEDGRLGIGNIDGFNIVLRDLTTGEATTLLKSTAAALGATPTLSPDAREFAYVWVEGTGLNDPGARQSLRVAATRAGSAPRTIAVAGQGIRGYFPVGWSADATAILVQFQTPSPSNAQEFTYSFGWVSVADGSLRTVKTLEPGRRVFSVRLSPDGRFVAYMAHVRGTERHIFTLDTRSGVESDVVKFAGLNNAPAWSADSAHLVFSSDHSGAPGLWAVRLRDGVAMGEPALLVNVPDGARPIRVTSNGTLQYSLTAGGGLVTFILDRNSIEPRLEQTIVGSNASWSPDGKWMALIRQTGQEHNIVVRSVASGDERLYRRQGIANVPPRWNQDGATFLIVVQESAAQAERYFYSVDRGTGEFRRLFPVDSSDSIRTVAGALSADGKTIYLGARRRTEDAPWTRIVAIDTSTGAEKSSIELPSGGLPAGFDRRVPGIALSPDGSTLAVEGWTDASMKLARIFTLRLDGGGYKEVYGPFPVDNTPDRMRWAPDGQSLLFTVVEKERVWRIMRVAAGGGAPTLEIDSTRPPALTPVPELNGGLWNLDNSPDGSRVLVGGWARARYELWAIENVLSLLSSR